MLIFVPLDHTQIGKWFSVYDTIIENYVALNGTHTWEKFEDYRSDAEYEYARGNLSSDRLDRLLAKQKEIIRW